MSNRMIKNPATGKMLILVLLGLLATASTVGAVPQIMTDYGDQMAWRSAEINAMGGTGVALYRGGMSNVYNPAMLSMAEGGRLDFSFSLEQEHEDRFQPLFDSFESYVADAAIASNRHHYWQTGFALAGRPMGEDSPLVAALSLVDRYAFRYQFDEELRNPSPFPPGSGEPARDVIIEERMRDVTGTLRNLSLGFGAEVTSRLSIGASVNYAFGTRHETNTLRDNIDPDNSYNHQDEMDMKGVNFTLGGRFVVTERVELGVAIESELAADGDLEQSYYDADTGTAVDTRMAAGYRYPQIFRAGLTFRPQTDPRTTFTIEGEFSQWSKFEDSRETGLANIQFLEDTMDVRIGLEHLFYNGVPVRFGFRYYESYLDKDAGSTVFSAGVGMKALEGMVSFSLELGKITSIQPHQFPYPADYWGDSFVTDPDSRVEDTRFRLGAGYTLDF